MFRAFICPKLAMETKVTRMFSLLIIIVKRVTMWQMVGQENIHLQINLQIYHS